MSTNGWDFVGTKVDFDRYMAEKMTQYEPLERDDEPQDVPRLSKTEVASFFANQKAVFAERTPEQEKKSFDAYFVRQNSMKERDMVSNLAALKSNPAFSERSASDLDRLMTMRTELTESMDKKFVPPSQQRAMLEKFDKVYAVPEALEKHKDALDFTKAAVPKQRDVNEQSL
jgi:hypothetical protein